MTITQIKNMTEDKVSEIALEHLVIKDHDIYFVDIDAMDDNNEDKYEEMIRSIIHKYVTDSYYYSTDGEVKDLRARKPYGSSLSNGHGAYAIKRKDEQEWIDSLFKK